MSTEEPTDEPETPRARGRRARGEGFALLGETLLTGVLVLAGSIPVVTLPAALAAGAAHLRRHVGGYDTSVRGYVHDWLAAVRSLWALGMLQLGVVAVVVVNTGLTASGTLPGASAVRWVTWLAAACAAVVLVRAATAWSDDEAGGVGSAPGSGQAPGSGSSPNSGSAPGSGAAARDAAGLRQVLSRGAARSRDDLTGSALLLAALVMCAVLVWMLVPLVLVTGGLLSLAAVAVETRRLERSV
ncbi:Poxvirus protein I5 [Promicromonospora aerolata]|uniref:Poxvirus protein I5 n=1 Tax=Promicromonospora aerolata TaxID=195749 RepID=A0ABW4VAV5_9MICO